MKRKEWTAKVTAWLERSISQYSPSFTYRSDLEMIMSIRQDPPCGLFQQESAKTVDPMLGNEHGSSQTLNRVELTTTDCETTQATCQG